MWLYSGVKHDDTEKAYSRTYFDSLLVKMPLKGFDLDTTDISTYQHFRFMDIYELNEAIDSIHHEIIRIGDEKMSIAHLERKKRDYKKHLFEKNRRISEAATCVLFMLLGLSIGILIKKGGMAIPGLIALGFFVLSYTLRGIGKDLADKGILEAWQGAWLPALVLGPAGIWLTYLALMDKEIAIHQKISQLWRLTK